MIRLSTFSIVAYDEGERAWGVAVASKFLGVGAVVPWAKAEVGAVATQSYVNPIYGSEGLRLMAEGMTAQEALDRLVKDDPDCNLRQVGIVDAHGGTATYTGSGCYDWMGGMTGPGFACQGNMLTGAETLQAMAAIFSKSNGELGDRLFAALAAGDKAGGDKRGRQAAALLVVRPNGGLGGFNDRYIDLRVDDDPQPIKKLAGLLKLHHLYFGVTPPEEKMPFTGDLVKEIQHILVRLGKLKSESSGVFDEATRKGLEELLGTENLEDRCDLKAGTIDPPALAYLREHFG